MELIWAAVFFLALATGLFSGTTSWWPFIIMMVAWLQIAGKH
jgi:hypothetical protein